MDQAAKEPKKTVNCYACGIDCTKLRFHYAKTEPATAGSNPNELKYDLCSNCYYQGRMPNTHKSSDFVKMEDPSYSSIPDKDAPWTDTETLLLLEGLEAFDNDWNEISNHVGTRTREECVMKFLQMDIQDPFMQDGLDNNSTSLRALGGLSGGRDPISQTENPVMSVVSFLAQMADPATVAAASGRTAEQMNKQLRERLEKGMDGSAASDSSKENVKPEGAADQMDVDTADQPTSNASKSSAHGNLATTALSLSASRSSVLASHEERNMTRLVGAAVNLTLQKFELKLAQFTELEEIIQAERRDLEKGRQQLFLDRLAFKKRMREVEAAMKTASLKGGEEGMRVLHGAMKSVGAGDKYGFMNGTSNGTNGIAADPLSQGQGQGDGSGFKNTDL